MVFGIQNKTKQNDCMSTAKERKNEVVEISKCYRNDALFKSNAFPLNKDKHIESKATKKKCEYSLMGWLDRKHIKCA